MTRGFLLYFIETIYFLAIFLYNDTYNCCFANFQPVKIITFLLVFCLEIFVIYLVTHRKKAAITGTPVVKTAHHDTAVANQHEVVIKTFAPVVEDTIPTVEVVPRHLRPDSLVDFAETLIGVPYKYASTDPEIGFDCSGFVTYVFNHFEIEVPRSSKDFENTGTEISRDNSKRGDLILFTGTDSTERVIGHMGIITSNDNGHLKFIHSTSGKAYGVTITDFNKYYQGRFVKTIRVFPELN